MTDEDHTTGTTGTTDLSSYVEGWRERARSRRAREAAYRESLSSRLEEVVDMLVRDFEVRRVVLFGSMGRGEARSGSDVDLLVEGLEPNRLIEASAAADRLLRVGHVDLVPAEIARPEVRARAEEEGTVLHG